MQYKGRVVRVDGNKQGAPLCGIPVSDGKNIVLTDENGEYTLDGWERARVINVGVLTNSHSDWYINIDGHKGDFDFFIDIAQTENTDFNFLHVSDMEISDRKSEVFLPFMRDTVKKQNPAFLINTGDLCGLAGLNRAYLEMNNESLGCPVRFAIGNHDFVDGEYGEKVYESLYGPTWYSFDCGDIHFIVLSIGWGDNDSGYEKKDQWLWLKNDLKAMDKSKKIVIFNHTLCEEDETGFCPEIDGEVFDLRGKGLLAWVFGHFHVNYLHEYDGVFNMCSARADSGGIDSTPSSMRKVSLKGHELSSNIIYNMGEIDEHSKSEWELQLDGNIGYTNPILVNGEVIVCTTDDGYPKNCGVYVISEKTGNIRYMYPTHAGIKGDGAYENGIFYVQDTMGNVYAIDIENEKLLWNNKCEVFYRVDYTRSGVIVANNLIIAGNHSKVYAFDKKTGEQIWIANVTEGQIETGENSPAKFVYNKYTDQVIISIHWKQLSALDRKTGKLIWLNKDEPECFFNTATPFVTEDAIYNRGRVVVTKMDPQTGKTLARCELDTRVDVYGEAVLCEDTLYFPTVFAGVVAVDKDTLEVKRYFECDYAKIHSSPYVYGKYQMVEAGPVIKGNQLIFAGNDGNIWFYDKDTGELLNKLSIGVPSFSRPIVGDDYVISTDISGRVIKFIL